jgi:hypothetical protein
VAEEKGEEVGEHPSFSIFPFCGYICLAN